MGGGIVGVTTALLLRRAGASVALVEARRIGTGVTGNSTAKLAAMHSLIYRKLARSFGAERSRAYASANTAGIERVAALVEELEIDCQLKRRTAITYVEDPEMRGQVEEEAEAAAAAGLEVAFTETTELPYPVAGAVRCENQAEFHPVRYLDGLVAAFQREGGEVFEETRVLGVSGLRSPVLRTDREVDLRAGQIVLATHLPILDRGLYFARNMQKRSYGLACRIPGEPPRDMYLSADSPTRSLRFIPDGDRLLVGGEGHKVGSGNTQERYQALADWAEERFAATEITHRWASHDNMPEDDLPMIGALDPVDARIHVATGMRKWGLAMGTTAADILTARCIGVEHELSDDFSPGRMSPKALSTLAEHNARSGAIFFKDRLTAHSGDAAPGGEGGEVVGDGLGAVAVSRGDDGTLTAVSARCTHLGCLVRWNSGDRTWDCPCHGSRFGPDGEVIQGPAVSPLKPVSVPDAVLDADG